MACCLHIGLVNKVHTAQYFCSVLHALQWPRVSLVGPHLGAACHLHRGHEMQGWREAKLSLQSRQDAGPPPSLQALTSILCAATEMASFGAQKQGIPHKPKLPAQVQALHNIAALPNYLLPF